MDRRTFYSQQAVTAAELNAAFDGPEAADRALTTALGISGIVAGLTVVPNPAAGIKVDIAPGAAYDPQGRRTTLPATRTIDLATASDGTPTAIITPNNQRWISISLVFARTASDPRTDGDGNAVNFISNESATVIVRAGAEALPDFLDTGPGPIPPPLQPGEVLVADVLRSSATFSISTTRRQDYKPAGSLTSWADGDPNPNAGFRDAIAKIISDLRGPDGVRKIGAGLVSGTPNSLPASTAQFQITQLLNLINGLVTGFASSAAGGDGAGRVGAAASGTLPAGTVRGQLDSLDQNAIRKTVANTFTATQTFNGGDGLATAGLRVSTANVFPRRLVWEVGADGGVKVRIYFTSGSRFFEITNNARWDGTNWVKDGAANTAATKFSVGNLGLDLVNMTASAASFGDLAWDQEILLSPANVTSTLAAAVTLNIDGVSAPIVGAPAMEAYAGWQGQATAGSTVGVGCTFRKKLATTPSSITFQTLDTLNTGSFAPIQANQFGVGVTATVTGTGTVPAKFFTRVLVS